MAVVPKHKDQNSRYDPSQDLTADQLHRFGKAASKAHERRKELAESGSVVSAARAAKDAAFRPVYRPKKDKPNTVRYAVWLVVVMVFSLWLMYMSR
ncbi:hypothetical protein H4F18_06610 [Vibrio scophthalmi]|uniref:hypothetical protein n=1 Tax=Vibrio scophthalmi TaxID=45658 RepID=UPI002FEE8B3D